MGTEFFIVIGVFLVDLLACQDNSIYILNIILG